MAKAFLKTKNENDVLVVDGLNMAFRWKHKGSTEFSNAYIDMVKSLARSYSCAKVIITADWGASSYRLALLPEYKANRITLKEKQTEAEKQAFEAFFAEYQYTLLQLEAEGFPVLKYKGVEADDIAAFIVKVRKELKYNKLWLVSSDRDWDLLISPEVSRFSYVTRKETTFDTWLYEFPIEEYITYKSLVGDTGDNIPGITGIGPKRAEGIMQQYGSIFDIYDACPLPGKYKYIQELNANAETLLLNVELMDLLEYCDVAIGEDNIKDIMEKLNEY